jgi:WD40 repeat protein
VRGIFSITTLSLVVCLACRSSEPQASGEQQAAPATEELETLAGVEQPPRVEAEPVAEQEAEPSAEQEAEPPAAPLPPFALARLSHGGPVTDVAWSGDGSRIATASRDGTVRLWKAQTWELERTLELPPSEQPCVALSHDGAIVVANAGEQLRVFAAETGSSSHSLAHEGPVLPVAVTPDGSRFVSGGGDGLRIWAADGSALHHLAHGEAGVISLALDGQRLASGWSDGRVRIHELDGAKLVATITPGAQPETLAFAGGYLAAPRDAEHFGIWTLSPKPAKRPEASVPLPRPLAFGFGGHLLLAADLPGTEPVEIHIVDVAIGEEVRPFRGHTATITAAAFAPDGNAFATASEDASALIWAAP